MMGVPLLRNGELEGVFTLMRRSPGRSRRVRSNSSQTFADQAVIAIENVRLFDEVQARTRDLTRGAAAADRDRRRARRSSAARRSICKTVLDTLIASGGASFSGSLSGVICLRDRRPVRLRGRASACSAGARPRMRRDARMRRVAESVRGAGSRLIRRIADDSPTFIADPEYDLPADALTGNALDARRAPAARRRVEGVFVLSRAGARRVSAAADRTRSDLRRSGRHRDRERAPVRRGAGAHARPHRGAAAADRDRRRLEGHQPLGVRSAGGVRYARVLRRRALRRPDGHDLRSRRRCVPLSRHDRRRVRPSALAQYLEDHPATPGRGTIAGRVLLSGKVERIPDCLEDPEYRRADGFARRSTCAPCSACRCCERTGSRASLILTRASRDSFSDRQIEIVQTFADQAVIAHRERAPVRRGAGAHERTRRLARRSAQGAGPADPVGEARLPRPAHRRHRPRDQEPAQFRQQFLGAVARADRRTARAARQGAARRGRAATRRTN